jgi:hypothetical protein
MRSVAEVHVRTPQSWVALKSYKLEPPLRSRYHLVPNLPESYRLLPVLPGISTLSHVTQIQTFTSCRLEMVTGQPSYLKLAVEPSINEACPSSRGSSPSTSSQSGISSHLRACRMRHGRATQCCCLHLAICPALSRELPLHRCADWLRHVGRPTTNSLKDPLHRSGTPRVSC